MTAGADEGAATPLVLGAVATLLVACAAALTVVGAVAASHRARSAADLAALAGAHERASGGTPSAACAEAHRVARANGAHLADCGPLRDGLVVVVTVDVPGWPEDAVARSRAGPLRDAGRGPP